MPHDLRFDSSTPEGQAIVELFTTVKHGLDTDWDGQALINGLVAWFAGLGFDMQADPPAVPAERPRTLRVVPPPEQH